MFLLAVLHYLKDIYCTESFTLTFGKGEMDKFFSNGCFDHVRTLSAVSYMQAVQVHV